MASIREFRDLAVRMGKKRPDIRLLLRPVTEGGTTAETAMPLMRRAVHRLLLDDARRVDQRLRLELLEFAKTHGLEIRARVPKAGRRRIFYLPQTEDALLVRAAEAKGIPVGVFVREAVIRDAQATLGEV